MKKTKRKHRIIRFIVTVFSVILLIILVGFIDLKTCPDDTNPHFRIILNEQQEKTLSSLRRVNDAGTLYQMDYYADYDNRWWIKCASFFTRTIGCTTFATTTFGGDSLMLRNYDFPHVDENNSISGLNVVFTLHPEGKYSSVNTADFCWLPSLRAGSIDNGKTNITVLLVAPYLCMDGMNEKGVSCSVMSVDIKDGEHSVKQKVKGKQKIMITQAERLILDNCATVDEAAELMKNYNMNGIAGNDYHLFVEDASGKSAIFEWRYDEFTVVYTDVATNFYLNSDDAQDCRYGDYLKEEYTGPALTRREYHYGYGHGYERFKIAVTALDKHLSEDGSKTVMQESDARELLFSCRQTYSSVHTSHTQYSAEYNLSQKELTIWVLPDYKEGFKFKL